MYIKLRVDQIVRKRNTVSGKERDGCFKRPEDCVKRHLTRGCLWNNWSAKFYAQNIFHLLHSAACPPTPQHASLLLLHTLRDIIRAALNLFSYEI